MRRYIFRIPEEYRALVKAKIAETHHQRLAIVVPLLAVLGLLFLGIDAAIIELEHGGLGWYYVGLDAGFVLLHVAFSICLWRGSNTTPNGVVYFYLSLVLFWAALTANIEFQRSGGFTAIFLTLLAVSALGVFSVRGILSLLTSTLAFYVGLNILWPGPTLRGLDSYGGLVAVPFLAFAISRTLYAAVARNVIANFELEQANAQLKEARLNLIRQDKLASLGVLSAGIAHEINNPLAFIRSNVFALENNLTSMQGSEALVAENRQILDETKEGFRRIGEVVQALRTFGRELPPGDLPPYDLNEGIRTTLVMTRHEVGPDIIVDTDLGELPLIRARGPEINQVLLNLVMNAFQAVRLLPSAEVRLVMVRTRVERGGVVAEVSNTGPAIPLHLREKIFEPFFSTKEPGAGMGLGLSLSWQIVVVRHGGELELLDKEPVTFRLRLPSNQSATQSTK